MAIDFSSPNTHAIISGRPTSTPYSSPWQWESETPLAWVFPTIIFFLVVGAIAVTIGFKYSQEFRDFLKKHFNFWMKTPVSGVTKNPEVMNTVSNEIQKKTTTVSINSERMSIGILLLCLFLPIFAPIIVLFRGKFLLLVGIIIAWIIAIVLLVIPFIGIVIAFIIDIIIAVQVAKSTKKTEVVVSG